MSGDNDNWALTLLTERVRLSSQLTLGSTIFVALGLWLSHASHVGRFVMADRDSIYAFPDWKISLANASFWSLAIVVAALGGGYCFYKQPRVGVAIAIAVVCFLISQSIGRSFYKALIDIGIWLTVLACCANAVIYDNSPQARTSESLRMLHSELLGVLRIWVNVCLFTLGTIGISVVSNVVARYFDSDLGQSTAWAYFLTLAYLAMGMMIFIVSPLFRRIVRVRRQVDALESSSVA